MLRAALKLVFILIWTGLWLGPVWLAKVSGKSRLRDRGMKIYSWGLLKIVGIHHKVHGQLSSVRPLLAVSNHLSYFDVPILASQAPVRFTPKSEIAGWPVVSLICRITDAVFVDRRPEKVREMRQALYQALGKGEVISLFPEATTGNGMHLLPFKSGFFSLAEEAIDGKELTIQPVALTYTRICKLPIDSTQWPQIAWYGDMNMGPHVWGFLKLASVDAELAFLPTVTLNEHGDRKKLAAHCHKMIAEYIERVKAELTKEPRQDGRKRLAWYWSKSKA